MDGSGRRVVVEDGGGELIDPLLGGAADPAAVLAAGGGERFGGDAAAEVVDADDLRRVPGGKVEDGETLAAALVREMWEETGLDVEPGRLLYICDHLPGNGSHVVHLTFEARRVGGTAGRVAAGLDTRPIRGVEFVKFADLPSLGFSERFGELAMAGFPGAGSYMDAKAAIGL